MLENDADSNNISLIYNQNVGSYHYFELWDGDSYDSNLAVEYVKSQTTGWNDERIIEKTIPTAQQIANAAGLTTWSATNTSHSVIPTSSSWLYENLSIGSGMGAGYWTSTPYGTGYTGWSVSDGNSFNINNGTHVLITQDTDHHSVAGVRPVIIIDKLYI